MLPIIIIGLFLLGSIGADPGIGGNINTLPLNIGGSLGAGNGSPGMKTYTLSDGTIVNEYSYTESVAAQAPVRRTVENGGNTKTITYNIGGGSGGGSPGNGSPGRRTVENDGNTKTITYNVGGNPGAGSPGKRTVENDGNTKTITYNVGGNPGAGSPGKRSSTQTITLSMPQRQQIKTEISVMPGTTINHAPGGSDTVSIPGNQLITLLKNHGIELPPGTITVNVDNPNGVITINLNGLFYVIDKKSEINQMHPNVKTLVNILQHDPTKPQDNKNPTIERTQVRTIINTLPGATVENLPGSPETISLPASSLQILLKKMGVPVPDDITKVPGIGPDPNKIITIYVDQVYKIIDNWPTFRNVSPSRIIIILRRAPGGAGPGGRVPGGAGSGGRVPGGAGAGGRVPGRRGPIADGPGGKGPGGNGQGTPGDGNTGTDNSGDSSLINGGRSYLANTGVNRREKCDRGAIDQTATQLKEGVNSGLNGIASTITGITGSGSSSGLLGILGGAVGAVELGKTALLTNAISGIDFAIQDAACGLGNIADDIAEAFDNGDIVGGVGNIGQEFFGGIANMGEDLTSQAGQGIGEAAQDIFGYLQKY